MYLNPANTLSFAQDTFTVFYQSKPYFTGNKIKILKFKFGELDRDLAIYLAAAFQKSLANLTWGIGSTVESIAKIKIMLPTKSTLPDFNYITYYIQQIEACYVQQIEACYAQQIEAYLTMLGYQTIDDVELTETDLSIIEKWKRSDKVKRSVSDIFNISAPKKKFNANSVKIFKEEGYPYIVRTSKNNGIRGFLQESEQFLNEANTIAFGQDTATIFYQNSPYFTGDKIKIMHSNFSIFNAEIALYLIATMNRAFSNFSWGSSSFNISILKNVQIQIPEINNEPDLKLMYDYIKVIEKKVVKKLKIELDQRLDKYNKLIK